VLRPWWSKRGLKAKEGRRRVEEDDIRRVEEEATE
tara:strand:+ start:695 stop:799 length:105 start_codon:yes stop_codon:yes gene_type:complete